MNETSEIFWWQNFHGKGKIQNILYGAVTYKTMWSLVLESFRFDYMSVATSSGQDEFPNFIRQSMPICRLEIENLRLLLNLHQFLERCAEDLLVSVTSSIQYIRSFGS